MTDYTQKEVENAVKIAVRKIAKDFPIIDDFVYLLEDYIVTSIRLQRDKRLKLNE